MKVNGKLRWRIKPTHLSSARASWRQNFCGHFSVAYNNFLVSTISCQGFLCSFLRVTGVSVLKQLLPMTTRNIAAMNSLPFDDISVPTTYFPLFLKEPPLFVLFSIGHKWTYANCIWWWQVKRHYLRSLYRTRQVFSYASWLPTPCYDTEAYFFEKSK